MLGPRVGMGHYMSGLLEAMLATAGDEEYLVFALGRQSRVAFAPVQAPSLSYRMRPLPRDLQARLGMAGLALPTELLLGRRADVFIWPNFVSWPTLGGARNIVVVHDLGFLLHGEYLTEHDRSYYRHMVPRSIRRADRVVVVSRSVLGELVERFGVREQDVTVISPAVDAGSFKPRSQAEIERVMSAYGLRGPYILYAGTLEPRKNIVGLLDAYEALAPDLRGRFQLVLVGGKGWLDADIERRLGELSELSIVTTGYVPDADLPALYSGASLFVYPSYYEGFGMPPLEAMACGTPVITSDNSSLPEVVGEAAIKIPAGDRRALSDSIERVLGEPSLAASMRERGLRQSQSFTWERSAGLLLGLIRELLDGSS
jgi:glycosyltransferase involved in cell wall biosynthesis